MPPTLLFTISADSHCSLYIPPSSNLIFIIATFFFFTQIDKAQIHIKNLFGVSFFTINRATNYKSDMYFAHTQIKKKV